MPTRVVSLLPAATEIVGALGMLEQLVGVSHECDYPESVKTKPRVTSCQIHGDHLSSREIDHWVSDKLKSGEDLYTIDEALWRELRPDLILTQRLCDVCAPAYGSVLALAQTLPGPPKVLDLEPNTLDDIFENIQTAAECADSRKMFPGPPFAISTPSISGTGNPEQQVRRPVIALGTAVSWRRTDFIRTKPPTAPVFHYLPSRHSIFLTPCEPAQPVALTLPLSPKSTIKVSKTAAPPSRPNRDPPRTSTPGSTASILLWS